MIRTQITGLERWFAVCDPARVTKELDAAVQRSAPKLRDEAKRMPPVSAARTGYTAKGIPVAPKYGGTLRQSQASRRAALMAADVYTGPAASKYADYVHGGTSKMPARPWYAYLMEDFGGTEIVQEELTQAAERLASP